MHFRAVRTLAVLSVAAGALLALTVGGATANSADAKQYLVIGTGSTLPAGLAKGIERAGGSLDAAVDGAGIAVATSSNPGFEQAVESLTGVESVTRSVARQYIPPVEAIEGPSVEFANPPTSGDDDFFFDLQWGHDAVDAPEAWNTGYRGAGATVAVLDTGFDLTHPDLAGQFLPASTSLVPGEPLQWADMADPFSHGTHTAGTVAAADNAFGTIGVAPLAELLLIKVLPDAGCGGEGPILEGIAYAADHGADVVNMSLGAPLSKRGYLETGCDPTTVDDVWVSADEVAEIRKAYQRVVHYANSKGTTVIASAGNDASDADHTADLIHLPSDAPGVLTISATAPIGWATDPSNAFLDYPTFYTNYGQSAIDFAAPGGSVEYPGNEDCTVAGLTRPCWVFDLVFSTGAGSWYWSAGTSMAAPHASGVAAIIIGKNGGQMSPAAVERALRRSADDLGKPGNDDFYGAGRVNAANAVG